MDLRAFAVELSRAPDLVLALIATHVPTADGRCRGCTTPGYGDPSGRWPCILRRLTDEAALIRTTPIPAARAA